MPLAITLRLAEPAAAAVHRLWHTLDVRAGANDSLNLGYHPHITLAVLPDDVPVAAVDPLVSELAASWVAFPVTLVGLAVFPGTPPVLWAVPVPSERLLRLQREVHAALAAFPVHPHYQPDAWVPHVTLAKEAHAPAERLMEVALGAWDGPLHGALDRLDLVRFRPVAVLRSEGLAAAPLAGEPVRA